MLEKMKRILAEKKITAEQARQDRLSQKRVIDLGKFHPSIMPNINNGPDYELFQEYLEALERNGVRPETMIDPRIIAQMRNGVRPETTMIDPRIIIAPTRNGVPVSSQPNVIVIGYKNEYSPEVMERLAQEKDRMGNIEQMGRMTNGNDKMQLPLGTRLKQMFKKKK